MEVYKKSNVWVLFFLLLFVVLFLGVGIIIGDFILMLLNVVIMIMVIVVLLMNWKELFVKKVEVFMKGVGYLNIVLMMLIFILVGVFLNIVEKMGGVKLIVNLGLLLILENLIIVGLFVICMFVFIFMGMFVGIVVVIVFVGYGFV